MQKISVITVLALALTLGTSSVVIAQSGGRPNTQRAGQQDSTLRRGPNGRGGPNAMLLRGITLSASQQTRVQELRDSQRKQMEANRPQGQPGRGENPQARVARERGDTTSMGARRAQMGQRREQHIGALRSILNADQRVQFDKNVAEMKAHAGERRTGSMTRNRSRPS